MLNMCTNVCDVCASMRACLRMCVMVYGAYGRAFVRAFMCTCILGNNTLEDQCTCVHLYSLEITHEIML